MGRRLWPLPLAMGQFQWEFQGAKAGLKDNNAFFHVKNEAMTLHMFQMGSKGKKEWLRFAVVDDSRNR